MPLTKLAKIDDNSFWAVWNIEEALPELIDLLRPSLSHLEQIDKSVHHPKKKLEWIAGRLALDSLLQHIGVDHYHLMKDIHGKPYLYANDIYISLANSFPYATAIVNTKAPVGIDIERPSEKLLKVSKKFLSSVELDHVRNNINDLCTFWCAKEAIYKVYGRKQLSFKDNILVKFDMEKDCLLEANVNHPLHSSSHKLVLEMIDEYHICYNIN